MMNSHNTNINTSCLICNGKKNHYDFSIDKYRVEECSNCGMLRLNPQPTDEELGKIYSSNYSLTGYDNVNGQIHVSALKSSTARRYLDLLESYMGGRLTG